MSIEPIQFAITAFMQRRRCLFQWLPVLLMLSTWPVAQASEADRLQQLRDAQRQFFDAIDGNDLDAVAAALTTGFVAIDANGGLRDRGTFLADLRAVPGGPGAARLRREWTQVRVALTAEQGVIVGRSTWRPASAEGTRGGNASLPIWSRLVTQHWRWQADRWLLQSQQVVLLPPPPEIVSFPSGPLTLQAMLFRPQGAGPFPSIVYAHGNEPDPGDLFETVGPALAARGYLVFGPHRRGAGLSADQAENLLRRLAQIERDQGPGARAAYALQQLQGPQLEDMAAAIEAVRKRQDVDPRRVYMIGNSFGGVLVMLAAERGLELAGAVNFAGAAINWERSEAFREVMTRAARNARVPLFVAQAANDYSTEPTRALGRVLCEAGKPHRARVYPPFGISAGEGHALGVDGVVRWSDEVFAFLAKPSANPECK